MINNPSLQHEIQYWEQGIELIAGIDEVGMGALAGPVVAAAVILKTPSTAPLSGVEPNTSPPDKEGKEGATVIRDSKTMSVLQKNKAAQWIQENSMCWAIGEATVNEIDTINIRQASHLAMKRAVNNLTIQPKLLLIDGNPSQPHSRIPATNIIKGDQLCYSIAAASILAKVHRDNLMQELSLKHPQYGWDTNVGYGSVKHKLALKKFGITKHHRKSYAPIAQQISTS